MRIELSRDDVETILKKYMSMQTVVLNKDGSATVDTTLEKIVSEPSEERYNELSYLLSESSFGKENEFKKFLDKINTRKSL